MKRSTKRKILDSALQLFNNQGIPNVSMREIADAAAISPGNLTYHFKRKNEIVDTLYYEFFENLPTVGTTQMPEPRELLERLLTPDLDAVEITIQYRFIVFDHNELMTGYPEIKGHFLEVMGARKIELTQFFQYLTSCHLLVPESIAGEYDLLARRQLIIDYFWMNDPGIDRRQVTIDDFICSYDVIKAGLWPYICAEVKSELKF